MYINKCRVIFCYKRWPTGLKIGTSRFHKFLINRLKGSRYENIPFQHEDDVCVFLAGQ